MSLPNAYLLTTKNVEAFFNAILSAQAPERFTLKFLENLEFKSTNDRLFIGVLKNLALLDESGVPTQVYYEFLDQTQSKQILARLIRAAYSDLFNIRKDAQNLTVDEVRNKFKTLTQGQKSDNVLSLMANTFKALCDYADWSEVSVGAVVEIPLVQKEVTPVKSNVDVSVPLGLQYNIQIHLPDTRDASVYDAIFKSLKEHLLK